LPTTPDQRIRVERLSPAQSRALRDDPDQEVSGPAARPTEAPGVDIGAIITRALTAAGLMKGR
jgi:hypothetical protein